MLIDPLPRTVELDGRDFPIETDFRTAILFELLVQDKAMTKEEKAIYALQLWFPTEMPENLEDATDKMLWFYTCGKIESNEQATNKSQKASISKRIYDFDVDAELIYAGFLTQYSIDLQDIEYMHWWKFSAMFMGLEEDREISKIMQYRAIDLSSIKNKAERKHYAELQAKYRLPDNRSTEDKEAIAGALFAGQGGR